MIGARDMAFPRLNAFGYWIFLFGGILLYFSYLGGEGLYRGGSAPDVGWFAYSPLTERAFSRGASTDYWILGILVSGFGSIASAINVIATISQHAMQRHDAIANAAVCLDDACGCVDGADRIAAAVSSADHAADRSLSRGQFLQYASGRLGCSVAAFLLDFWAPGSLHPDSSRPSPSSPKWCRCFPESRYSAARRWWAPP